jgi:hypothetical protein
MVLEQDQWGNASHRAADLTPIGDGMDPVTQFVLLDTPPVQTTAQVLWEASEKPIPWVREADEPYRFVEYAMLPEDARIEYLIFTLDPRREIEELKHIRRDTDADLGLDASLIDGLSNGVYLVMARLRVPGLKMHIITQRIKIVDRIEDAGEFGPVNPDLPEIDPIPQPNDDALQPGGGWTGPTPVPDQIGDSDEPAIAHWNVVPEQQIEDGFTVGVIAHHLEGVDRVEISANNGPWVKINAPSINPRTECEEYWTTLDLSRHSGKVELRAIVYPTSGQPVLVTPLGDEYRKQDLTLYPFNVGEVLELGPGRHRLIERELPERGWLIVRPKEGVAREDVILVGGTKDWRDGRLKLENLTIEMPSGGSGIRGRWSADYLGQFVWVDGCRIIGNGPKDQTWWCTFMWEASYYTNTEISHVQTAFHSGTGMVRNCHVHTIYEDVFRMDGLHVNVLIENVDREPMIQAQNLSGNDRPHPDLWQRQTLRDTISQDITATNNINAQGFFPRHTENVALVRVKVDNISPYRALQMMGDTANVLIEDCEFDNGNFRGTVLPGERLLIRDSIIGNDAPFLPFGWQETVGLEAYRDGRKIK